MDLVTLFNNNKEVPAEALWPSVVSELVDSFRQVTGEPVSIESTHFFSCAMNCIIRCMDGQYEVWGLLSVTFFFDEEDEEGEVSECDVDLAMLYYLGEERYRRDLATDYVQWKCRRFSGWDCVGWQCDGNREYDQYDTIPRLKLKWGISP